MNGYWLVTLENDNLRITYKVLNLQKSQMEKALNQVMLRFTLSATDLTECSAVWRPMI